MSWKVGFFVLRKKPVLKVVENLCLRPGALAAIPFPCLAPAITLPPLPIPVTTDCHARRAGPASDRDFVCPGAKGAGGGTLIPVCARDDSGVVFGATQLVVEKPRV